MQSNVLDAICLFYIPYIGKFRDDRTGSYACSGSSGWSLDVIPPIEILREHLRIHPDGGVPGTLGCVGVKCAPFGGADDLGAILREIYKQNQSSFIQLEVK